MTEVRVQSLIGGDLQRNTTLTRAKIVRHAKYVTFQLAEVAVPRRLFAAILDRIAQLAIPPFGAATPSC